MAIPNKDNEFKKIRYLSFLLFG